MKNLLINLLIVILLMGCTNATIKDTNELVKLSEKYTEDLTKYLDESQEIIIDAENYSLITNQMEQSNDDLLKESNKNIQGVFYQVNNLKEIASLLNEYFTTLNYLIDNGANKKVAESIESISLKLGAIEGKFEGKTKGLTEEALKMYYAYKVSEIIKRDHKKIAEILYINNIMLLAFDVQLNANIQENIGLKKRKIEKAYSNKKKQIDSVWGKDRVEIIKLETIYPMEKIVIDPNKTPSENLEERLKKSNNPAIKSGVELGKAWETVGQSDMKIEDLQNVVRQLIKFNKMISELEIINESNN
ncbi:MAG: hypothetical protein ACRC2N_02735 [Aeromonas sp.]